MTDFPKATVTPDGCAYRIAEALMHEDSRIVGVGAVLWRLAGELGVTAEVGTEIRIRALTTGASA